MNLPDIDISTLVPHDKPMLLLDSVLEADENTMKTCVAIRDDSLFCKNGIVGAWVGIEYMAQSVAAHAGFLAKKQGRPVKIGYLLGSRHYQCHVSEFNVGDTLEITAERQYEMIDEGLGSYLCTILHQGNQIASAVCTVYQPPES